MLQVQADFVRLKLREIVFFLTHFSIDIGLLVGSRACKESAR